MKLTTGGWLQYVVCRRCCICLQFRFCFCAVATLSLLGRLDAVNTDLTAKFVQSCQNFDGGFGSRVGAESHAGLIYTCLGTLAITGHLHTCDQDRLAWWLAERQLPSGGLNGRPGTEECHHHI